MDTIFAPWPTLADLARDLGQSPVTVRHWRRRGSIPAKYHLEMVEAAKRRGHPITFEQIAKACANKADAA